MTLCIAWKTQDETIHLAADSRISLGSANVDLAIKVCALPYKIIGPTNGPAVASIYQSGEIGLCFAGSTVALYSIKETVSEVLQNLQCIPSGSVSLKAIAEIVYSIYHRFIPPMTDAMLGPNGVVNLIIAGHCNEAGTTKAYKLETTVQNQVSFSEILQNANSHALLGSRITAAAVKLQAIANPSTSDYLNTLKDIVDDPSIPDVGGHIVYGCTGQNVFTTFGVQESDSNGNIGYWRGGLNYNHPDFQLGNSGGLNVTYPMLSGW